MIRLPSAFAEGPPALVCFTTAAGGGIAAILDPTADASMAKL